jgi:hypothetical protein
MCACRTVLAWLLVASALGCGRGCADESAEPVATPAPAALAVKPAPAPPAAAEEPTDAGAADGGNIWTPKPGWSKVVVDDLVPFCVFESYGAQFDAKFLKDAKKQTLKADAPVVIGPYGPWCVHESCDDLPSLQCSAKLEANNTIVVKSHYWALHKNGAACKETCRPVSAGCETPPLPAGKYTIQHGNESYKLKIPSVLRSPCFGKELDASKF